MDGAERPRRGRPPRSAEQREAIRARIINAARDLFAEHGYAGVSMRRIAATAGCQPSALYALFPGKRDLLHHLWADVFAALRAELSQVGDASSMSVRTLCLAVIDFWLRCPADYRAIFLVDDRPEGAGDGYFAQSAAIVEFRDVLRQSVVREQSRGEIAEGDAGEIADVLLSGVLGVTYSLIAIPEYGWIAVDRLAAATVDALLAGLRP